MSLRRRRPLRTVGGPPLARTTPGFAAYVPTMRHLILSF